MLQDILVLGFEIMALNNIQKYEVLNTVLPFFHTTRYPYNTISHNKIIETQKEIELVYQHEDAFFSKKPIKPNKKGGDDEKINVYLWFS